MPIGTCGDLFTLLFRDWPDCPFPVFLGGQTMQRIPTGGLRCWTVMPLRMRMERSLHGIGVPDRMAGMLT